MTAAALWRLMPQQPLPARLRDGTTGDGGEKSSGSGRGRSATTPREIPKRGWRDVVIRVYREFSEDRIMANAAGVTFYALLAIFPAITALVSIYGLVADPAEMQQHLSAVADVIPGGGVDIIREQMARIARQSTDTLGLGAIVGLLIALWSANSGVKAMFDALNVVYDEEEKRGFFRLNFVSLVFTLAAFVLVFIFIGLVVAMPLLQPYLPMQEAAGWIASAARWPILLLVILFTFAVLYRFGPSRDQPKWRWVTWGSAIAAAGWLLVSVAFSWYTANFGNYDATYGSLGAAIGFMTWIWLSIIVVLLGAEINAELEHQTARDTTVGPTRPLGLRGAAMADRVGPAQG